MFLALDNKLNENALRIYNIKEELLNILQMRTYMHFKDIMFHCILYLQNKREKASNTLAHMINQYIYI